MDVGTGAGTGTSTTFEYINGWNDAAIWPGINRLDVLYVLRMPYASHAMRDYITCVELIVLSSILSKIGGLNPI